MSNIIDISRELTTAPVYPGDPTPYTEALCRMAMGDVCNTTVLHACLHTGTHLDAPRHFIVDGEDTNDLPLEACIGECSVIEQDGVVVGSDIEKRLWGLRRRVLFKGNATLSQSAAFVLCDAGVQLVGVEGQSVSTAAETGEVHRQLLGNGVVILEGLHLSAVREGTYFLFAAPLKVKDGDGAPVRAVLLERKD